MSSKKRLFLWIPLGLIVAVFILTYLVWGGYAVCDSYQRDNNPREYLKRHHSCSLEELTSLLEEAKVIRTTAEMREIISLSDGSTQKFSLDGILLMEASSDKESFFFYSEDKVTEILEISGDKKKVIKYREIKGKPWRITTIFTENKSVTVVVPEFDE